MIPDISLVQRHLISQKDLESKGFVLLDVPKTKKLQGWKYKEKSQNEVFLYLLKNRSKIQRWQCLILNPGTS